MRLQIEWGSWSDATLCGDCSSSALTVNARVGNNRQYYNDPHKLLYLTDIMHYLYRTGRLNGQNHSTCATACFLIYIINFSNWMLCEHLDNYAVIQISSMIQWNISSFWSDGRPTNELRTKDAQCMLYLNVRKHCVYLRTPAHHLILTHCSLETHKRVTGKQCRPRSDAAECGVWSGSPLFSNSSIIFL